MGIPVGWICTKCGRKTQASSKPGTNGTDYGKCKDGTKYHNWVKR